MKARTGRTKNRRRTASPLENLRIEVSVDEVISDLTFPHPALFTSPKSAAPRSD